MNASGNRLAEEGLVWEFIPAATPHYGGVWERMVGLFKRHLAAMTNGDVLHIDTFSTILILIEKSVNKRPITAMSTDPSDPEAITPSHILYPSTFAHSSAIIVPEGAGDDSSRLRSSWRRAEARADAFWKQWSKDYMTMLHTRPKWQRVERNVVPGSIVIIMDETKARDA